jgi:hypothetical protein
MKAHDLPYEGCKANTHSVTAQNSCMLTQQQFAIALEEILARDVDQSKIEFVP